MIAVDTNVLVYAAIVSSQFHPRARALIKQLSESSKQWAIPLPCLHEFFAIVTHPRIYSPAASPAQAWRQIEAWTASPSLVLLSESRSHLDTLGRLVRDGDVRGPLIHDARVAAICIDHGVRELVSQDRDFSRFAELTVRPL